MTVVLIGKMIALIGIGKAMNRKAINMNDFLFKLVKILYKMGFMKTRFYKKFCYNSIIGEKICDLICEQMSK